jgi:hypothetical protein
MLRIQNNSICFPIPYLNNLDPIKEFDKIHKLCSVKNISQSI